MPALKKTTSDSDGRAQAPRRSASEPKLSIDKVKDKLTKLKHPRVTEETMKAQIASVSYMTPENAPITTVCSIAMKNGFIFIGTSTPAAPENFNADIGQRYAYENALRQIWTHEGYLLKFALGLCDRANDYGMVNVKDLLTRFHVPEKAGRIGVAGKAAASDRSRRAQARYVL